jgi:hypothetical protein
MAYSVSDVTILATPTNTDATVTGNGKHTLSVGVNVIEIYATSQVGTKGEVYTLTVNRTSADTNNYLSSLTVADTASGDTLTYQPTFVKTTQKYTLDLTDFPTVTEIEITAETESIFAESVDGTGIFALKTASGKSTETFYITVNAEDGGARKYELTVIRDVDPADDITISELSLIGSDSVNYLGTSGVALKKFTINTTTYSVTVPYRTSNATLTVANANGASVTGNGNYILGYTSPTVISFYLNSQSGKYTSATYTINVTREAPSDDAALSSLTVDGKSVSDFNPLITAYEMTVSLEDVDSIVVAATANDPNANVIGDLGSVALGAGSNTVNITVRAEDGSSQTYTLLVKRLSTDNLITDLGAEGYDMSSPFNQGVTTYTVAVPYTTDKVTIFAVANTRATLTGTGIKHLSVGTNNFNVFATSEQGVKGVVYTMIVTREAASSDATLKSLSVVSGSDGQALSLSPAFNASTTSYILQIASDSGINSLTINAAANSAYAQGVGGTGYKVLKAEVDGLYNNVFEIIVDGGGGGRRTALRTLTR